MNIPDNKLYREVINQTGQFAGTYRVYWNKHILKLMEPETRCHPWLDSWDAPVGDYIESMDGTCLLLLDKRELKDKDVRYTTRFFRFPVSTIVVRKYPDGTVKYRDFYGNFMTASKSTQEQQPRSFIGKDNQKIRFASLILQGLNPIKAYQAVHSWRATTPIHSIHKRINKLMSDEIVVKEIKNQIVPFMSEMGKNFTDEELIKEIKSLLKNSVKGSPAHRDNIEFVLHLSGKMPKETTQKRKLKMIQMEEEISPPPED
jgi:hypothetical protein